MSPHTRVNHILFLILDNVRSDQFFQLMAAGKLPNMGALAANGIRSETCVTTFPSITYPTQSNMICGAYSGYWPKEGIGIPTYHWFNRSDPPSIDPKDIWYRSYAEGISYLKMNDDLGPGCRTIYEQAGDGNYLSSMHPCNRGSLWYPSNKLHLGLFLLWNLLIKKDVDTIDYKVLRFIGRAFEKPGKFFRTNEAPRIATTVLMGTDEHLHFHGADSRIYINHLLALDKYIGELVETLKATGYYDDTAICITSDHGNYHGEEYHNLEPFFERKGLRPFSKKARAGDFDATVGSVGMFNFPGDSWHIHPTRAQLEAFQPSGTGAGPLNIYDTLWEVPGTQVMYYPDDANTPDAGTIHIERRVRDNGDLKVMRGRVEFRDHGKAQQVKYTWDGDAEIFGYDPAVVGSVLDGQYHAIDDWLAATHTTEFPLLIDQLPRYFKNPRACDVMISTWGQTMFQYEHGGQKHPEVHDSHDIEQRRAMVVPLVIGGSPEIGEQVVPFCKTTDIAPTLLELLGETPHPSVVGRSLFS